MTKKDITAFQQMKILPAHAGVKRMEIKEKLNAQMPENLKKVRLND